MDWHSRGCLFSAPPMTLVFFRKSLFSSPHPLCPFSSPLEDGEQSLVQVEEPAPAMAQYVPRW